MTISRATLCYSHKLVFITGLILFFTYSCQAPNSTTSPASSARIASSARQISPTIQASPFENPCIIQNRVYCALNPDVVPENISTTICKSGYTRMIRPPVSFTDDLKQHQVDSLYLGHNVSEFEEDHRMPLELGGAPGSPSPDLDWENVNLSPEFGASPNAKDGEENQLHDQVCHRRTPYLGLREAQVKMVNDWLGPFPNYKK